MEYATNKLNVGDEVRRVNGKARYFVYEVSPCQGYARIYPNVHSPLYHYSKLIVTRPVKAIIEELAKEFNQSVEKAEKAANPEPVVEQTV